RLERGAARSGDRPRHRPDGVHPRCHRRASAHRRTPVAVHRRLRRLPARTPPRGKPLHQPGLVAHRRAGSRPRQRADPASRRLLLVRSCRHRGTAALRHRTRWRRLHALHHAQPRPQRPAGRRDSRRTRDHHDRTAGSRRTNTTGVTVATLLYRLGRFAYRRAWIVIGAWVLALAAILGGGFALGGQMQESFVIPGTESQSALDRLASVFPQVAGASAQVVSVAPDGASVDDEQYQDAIEKMATDIRRIDGINSVLTPFDEYAGTAVSD